MWAPRESPAGLPTAPLLLQLRAALVGALGQAWEREAGSLGTNVSVYGSSPPAPRSCYCLREAEVCVCVLGDPGRAGGQKGAMGEKPAERRWWSSGLGLLHSILDLGGSGLVDRLPLLLHVPISVLCPRASIRLGVHHHTHLLAHQG